MDVIKMIQNEILTPLEVELDILRKEVFEGSGGGRSWERSVQKFDETAIKVYQTKYIIDEILRGQTYERNN